jgi:hypothetical protein
MSIPEIEKANESTKIPVDFDNLFTGFKGNFSVMLKKMVKCNNCISGKPCLKHAFEKQGDKNINDRCF